MESIIAAAATAAEVTAAGIKLCEKVTEQT